MSFLYCADACGGVPAVASAVRSLLVVPGAFDYDEFGLFEENATEFGLPYDGPPAVARRSVTVEPGRSVSALVWGTAPRTGAVARRRQNAHTWDTVAMALGRPLVAVDLPSHGHSDGSPYGSGAVAQHAVDVAAAFRVLAPVPLPVVGMSLGGLTALSLAAELPEVVSALVLVDVTPGVNADKAAPITAFINGPASFDSFDDLLARTIEFNPTRTESSLRQRDLAQRRAGARTVRGCGATPAFVSPSPGRWCPTSMHCGKPSARCTVP